MELFRKAIKSYLDEKAAGDPAFAERYSKHSPCKAYVVS